MAPTLSILMSSGSKKKEHRYLCLSEAKASHSPKICTEVSSSVPHFLQAGLLLSPITCRYLLKVLCPVSRPITTLDCVLLEDNNRAPVARLGSQINSRIELASVYHRDYPTMPDAVSASSVSSFFLCSVNTIQSTG